MVIVLKRGLVKQANNMKSGFWMNQLKFGSTPEVGKNSWFVISI